MDKELSSAIDNLLSPYGEHLDYDKNRKVLMRYVSKYAKKHSKSEASIIDEAIISYLEKEGEITLSDTKYSDGKFDIDLLTVGVGKSQREQINDLKNIIIEFSKEYGNGGVPLERITEKAAEHGISQEKVQKELKKLKEIGEIFEPNAGRYSTNY